MYRLIAILTLLICFFATSAQATQISVEPAYQEAFNGDNITVDITVYPEENGIYGASYMLYFNNTIINATSQIQGQFLRQDGQGSNIYLNEINNTLGRIEYAECRLGTWDNVIGPGVLATIEFEVIGEEGVSQLNLSDLEGEMLYSTTGPVTAVINNGSFEVRQGICGDVNDDCVVNMADVMTMWYDYADYPTPGAYTTSNEWTADVNCDSIINMADVMTLWYDYADYPTPGAYEVNCCGG